MYFHSMGDGEHMIYDQTLWPLWQVFPSVFPSIFTWVLETSWVVRFALQGSFCAESSPPSFSLSFIQGLVSVGLLTLQVFLVPCCTQLVVLAALPVSNLRPSLPQGLQHTASLGLRHTALAHLELSIVPLFQWWTLPTAHMHPLSLRPRPPSSKKPLLFYLHKVTPWPVFLPPHFPLSYGILSSQGQDRTMRAHTCLQSPSHSPLPGTGGPVLDPVEEISHVFLIW